MDYVELADYYAEQYGLDPTIFRRMIMQESGFDPEARNERSGALGIAQIMEDSARQPGFGIDPIEDRLDPEQSLRFGAQYLRAMLDRYDGDYSRALAAYNAGPGTVDQAGGIPDIAETQTYVRNILGGEDIERPTGAMSEQGLFATPEGLSMLREERDPEAGMRMVYQMLQQQRAREAAVQAPAPTAQVQPGRGRGFNEGGSVEQTLAERLAEREARDKREAGMSFFANMVRQQMADDASIQAPKAQAKVQPGRRRRRSGLGSMGSILD